MSGEERQPGRGAEGERAHGEAVRSGAGPSAGRAPGVIDQEQAAREESELEEGKPSAGARRAAETEEERLARERGKAGPGELTEHVPESERRAEAPGPGRQG